MFTIFCVALVLREDPSVRVGCAARGFIHEIPRLTVLVGWCAGACAVTDPSLLPQLVKLSVSYGAEEFEYA